MPEDRTQGLRQRLTGYGDPAFAVFLRRTFARSMGYSPASLDRPSIGILHTSSDLNNCHRHFPEMIESVKRGVWQAGGLPLAFPAISLGEVFLHPTSMLFRNLLAMDAEEMLRAQPLDAAVLLGGCDKTIPALLMGAASANIPAIALAAGPMLSGSHESERVCACTDCRRYWARYRAGEIPREEIDALEGELAPTSGTCGVMGTASSMACVAEALGMMLPGGASIPAVHAARLAHAEETGRRALEMAREQLTPDRILTRAAFENALRALLAIGGSTNGVIHLTAIAGRVGIRLTLDDLERVGQDTPVLVDLKPSGQGTMEDFHRAGGMPAVLRELSSRLERDALTVTGKTLGELIAGFAPAPAGQTTVRPAASPFHTDSALAVLRGNLAPDGALLKRSAASQHLLHATGRAVVFHSQEDLAARIDDPALDVRPDDFLVLRNAGPVGGPGMPEAGFLPIPRKLQGVRDMVRISDARMSGTAFGTVVLHVAPEAAVGGPIALVRDGDRIALDAPRGRLDLLVDDAELLRRRSTMVESSRPAARGWLKLYREHVQQAPLGCDLDFLRHESLQS